MKENMGQGKKSAFSFCFAFYIDIKNHAWDLGSGKKNVYCHFKQKRDDTRDYISCNRIITSGVGVLKLKLSGNALKSTGEQVLELCIVWTLRNNGWLILEAPWPVLLLRSSVLLWIICSFLMRFFNQENIVRYWI